MGSARIVVLVAAVFAASVPAIAGAHGVKFPKHDHFRLIDGRLEVEIDYTIPPGDRAAQVRRLFDANADSRLDDSERLALRKYLRAEATRFLEVEFNGTRLSFEETSVELGGVDLKTTASGEITSHWKLVVPVLPKSRRSNELVIRDRHKDRNIEVPVLVRVGKNVTRHLLSEQHPEIRVKYRALDAHDDAKIQ